MVLSGNGDVLCSWGNKVNHSNHWFCRFHIKLSQVISFLTFYSSFVYDIGFFLLIDCRFDKFAKMALELRNACSSYLL